MKSRPSIFTASALYLLAAAGLWLISLVSALLQSRFPQLSYDQFNLLISLCYYLSFLFLPVALWSNRQSDLLRLNPLPFRQMLLIVLLALLCMPFADNLTVFWMALWQKLGLNVFTDTYVRPASTADLMRSVIAGAVIAPVCEEMLLRGAVLSAWEARGTRRAIAVTAALFAILHGSLIGLPSELLCGLILGALVVWTDSLYAGMAFHSVYNAAVILTNYLSTAPSMAESAEATSLMHTDILAYLGGPTIALTIAETLVLLIILRAILRFLHLNAYDRVMREELMADDSEETMLEIIQRARAGGSLLDPKRDAELKRNDFIPPERLGLSAGEILMIMAGVVTALGLYAITIPLMLGG